MENTAQDPLNTSNSASSISDQELWMIFENLPGAYLILDPELRIVTANQAYLKATMQEIEGIKGQFVFDVFPDNPADPDAGGVRNLSASLERVLRSKKQDVMPIQKYDVRNRDGTFEEKYWSPINSPVVGPEGKLRFIVHRVEDVTEFLRNRNTERELNEQLQIQNEHLEAALFKNARVLKESEERLYQATAKTGIGVWEVDVLTQKSWRTPSHDQAYGFSDYSPGRSLEEFFARIVEEERDTVRSHFQESLLQGKDFAAEYRIEHLDGTIHWMAAEGRSILGAEGSPRRLIGTIRDITGRKNAEEALRKAEAQARIEKQRAELARQELYDFFMQAPIALCMLSGPEHKYTLANPKFLETSGRNPVGKTVEEAFTQEEAGHYLRILNDVYQTGRAYIGEGLPFPRRDSKGEVQELYLDVGYHPFRDHDGSIKGILAVVNDVTDRALAQKRLQVTVENAESANAAKSSFLANMSHEIRTPMTAVLGFAELLRDPTLTPEEKSDAINRIENSGRSLLRILDDVLDISKIEAGRLAIHKSLFSPLQVVSEVISLLKLTADQKQISLQFVSDSSVPVTAFSDAARIRQILINLIGNAIKFTAAGEVVVRLRGEGSSTLIFEVTDTGIGTSNSDQAKLFQPFAQADGSITRNFGGTGLGLLLSRRLCEGLGGNLVLNASVPGQGSVFVARIDAGPFNYQTLETQLELRSSDEKISENKLAGWRILLAEDVIDNQMLMKKYLTSAGAEVVIASNGEEAVRKALQGDFDLVLMDIQMPDKDGIQATKELRAQGWKKPILALTAHALKEEVERSLQAGCNGHLTKPITRRKLIEAIFKPAQSAGGVSSGSHLSGGEIFFSGETNA